MIPEFPAFERLQPTHGPEFQRYTTATGDYSEASLATHLAWDIDQQAQISQVYGNAVLLLAHHETGQQFLSLQGTQQIDDSVASLLAYCEVQGLPPRLDLIPEETVQAMQQPDAFSIEADRDNFDYVVSLAGLASLVGPALRNTRRKVHRFIARHPNHRYVELDALSPHDQALMLNIFDQWQQQTGADSEIERHALQQMLALSSMFELEARGMVVDDRLQAFIVLERSRNALLGHFWKANMRYEGVYAYLMHHVAIDFVTQGYNELNIEEDMGMPGLRESKSYFNPTFLRKYAVSKSATPPLVAAEAEPTPSHAYCEFSGFLTQTALGHNAH